MPSDQELFDWLRETSPASAMVVVAAPGRDGAARVGPRCRVRRRCVARGVRGPGRDRARSASTPWSRARVALGAAERYRRVDLNRPFDPRPSLRPRRVPRGRRAPPATAPLATLVSTLVRSAPVVAFSAAIPGQGGIGHVERAVARLVASTLRGARLSPTRRAARRALGLTTASRSGTRRTSSSTPNPNGSPGFVPAQRSRSASSTPSSSRAPADSPPSVASSASSRGRSVTRYAVASPEPLTPIGAAPRSPSTARADRSPSPCRPPPRVRAGQLRAPRVLRRIVEQAQELHPPVEVRHGRRRARRPPAPLAPRRPASRWWGSRSTRLRRRSARRTRDPRADQHSRACE